MISKQDIFDRAVEWQLRHDVVEKDYVLWDRQHSAHSKNDSALRAHKTPDGSRCWGRRGHLVRTD